jgi:hypothetical protein
MLARYRALLAPAIAGELAPQEIMGLAFGDR